jgi:hypothetical protein
MTARPIVQLFQGKMSQRSLTRRYIPAVIAIFALLLALASILFPADPAYPYNWTTSTISRLGWPFENTTGWVFFTLAFLFLGIFTIPLAPFYFRKFSAFNKRVATVVAVAFLAASAGEFLLGAIPNFNTPDHLFSGFHKVDAVLAFLGIYLAAIVACVTLFYYSRHTKINILPRHFGAGYGFILAYGVFAVCMMLFAVPNVNLVYYVYNPATPLFLSVPLWEWQSFVIALFLGVAPSYLKVNSP